MSKDDEEWASTVFLMRVMSSGLVVALIVVAVCFWWAFYA